MKKLVLLPALLLMLVFTSCGDRTWVCECGESTGGFTEEGRYDKEAEAQNGCNTTEFQLKQQNPDINCLVREL